MSDRSSVRLEREQEPALPRQLRGTVPDQKQLFRHIAVFLKTMKAVLCHDYMVDDRDAYHFARIHQSPSYVQVFSAWRRISTRMIVYKNDARSRRANGRPEDLPRMNQACGQRSLRNLGFGHHAISTIEQ